MVLLVPRMGGQSGAFSSILCVLKVTPAHPVTAKHLLEVKASLELKLAFDGLFFATALNQLPAVFASYTGQLSSSGSATARINIPNFSVLRGVTLHTAFLVINASSPSGISKISTPVIMTIN